MDRRKFFQYLGGFLAITGWAALSGCSRREETNRLGNQSSKWDLILSQEEIAEPLVPPYAENSPAAYRDASLSKADPNFQPKIGGG